MFRPRGRLPSYRTSRDYLVGLRRHARLFCAVLALGVLGGIAYSAVRAPEYAASASVLVTPTGVTDPNPARNRAPGGVDLDTEIQFVQSAPTMKAAAKLVKLNPTAVSEHLRISVPPNSRVLRMIYTAHHPDRAADGANAVAQAYLQLRHDYAAGILAGQIARTREQIADLDKRLRYETDKAAANPKDSASGAFARSNAQLLQRQDGFARQRLNRLTQVVVTPGSVLSAATVPTAPAGAGLRQRAVEGLMLGLLAACLAVALAQRRAPRIVGVEHLHSLLSPAAVAVQPAAARAGRTETALAGNVMDALPWGGTVAIAALTAVPDVQEVLEVARAVQAFGYRTSVVVWPQPEDTVQGRNSLALPEVGPEDPVAVSPAFIDRGLRMHTMAGSGSTGRKAISAALRRLRAQTDFLFVVTLGPRATTHPAAMVADNVILVVRDGETTTRHLQRASLRADERRVLGAMLLPATHHAAATLRHPLTRGRTATASAGSGR